MERYASLTGTSFRSLFTALANLCAPRITFGRDSRALTAAAAELERARRIYLEGLRAFSARRRVEKRSGTGQMRPSHEAASALRAAMTLGVPLAEYARPAIPEVVPQVVEPLAPVPPEFEIGAPVEVLLNVRNKTARRGRIQARDWHFKYQRWVYWIRQGRRVISKRYFADDLRLGSDVDP